MGTWGHGSFENDTAMDWIYGLEETSEMTILGDTIGSGLEMMESEEGMDADTACNVLAAAEVIAAMRGKPSEDLPDSVKSWIEGKPKAPPELSKAAFLTVNSLLQKSELKELWDESDESAKWVEAVNSLVTRLK